MKALVLNALGPKANFNVAELLAVSLGNRGWEHQVFFLEEMDIKPCTSCGNCAAKTPGRCAIKDDMEKLYSGLAKSQLVIFCSPISFGGYHSSFKILQDRIMPMNTAFFTVRKGELHHKSRYCPTPSLMTVGLLRDNNAKEKTAFEYLTERNAINMNIDRWTSVVLTPEDRPEEVLGCLEQALKEVI